MSEPKKCESYSMPIDAGIYCPYCVDDNGNLQSFEERFEEMVQWSLKEEPNISREEAENRTRAHMRAMPAWKNHTDLASD